MNTVKKPLTPFGQQLKHRHVVENDEFAAFARRIIRAHGRRVQEELDASRPRELPLARGVEAVAVRDRRQREQPAALELPVQQRRILREQPPQRFDVIIVDGALGLRGGPGESVAGTPSDFTGEILPSGVAVLARHHELGIAPGERQHDIGKLSARTRDGGGIVGGGVTGEPAGLLAQRLE